jgi:hypothetical protein
MNLKKWVLYVWGRERDRPGPSSRVFGGEAGWRITETKPADPLPVASATVHTADGDGPGSAFRLRTDRSSTVASIALHCPEAPATRRRTVHPGSPPAVLAAYPVSGCRRAFAAHSQQAHRAILLENGPIMGDHVPAVRRLGLAEIACCALSRQQRSPVSGHMSRRAQSSP